MTPEELVATRLTSVSSAEETSCLHVYRRWPGGNSCDTTAANTGDKIRPTI